MGKKVLKNVALIATTIPLAITISTITSCSCTVHTGGEEEQPELSKIELILPNIPERIMEGRAQQTSPIRVNCYDQKGNVMKVKTKLIFTTDTGEPVPDWIWIDSVDNTIHINGNNQPSTNLFKLSAVSENDEIKTTKQFGIEVFAQPIIGPDEINILCDDTNPTIMTTSNANIEMTIEAFKPDYPSEIIDKSCDWFIKNLVGNQTTDLDGNPLFKLVYDEERCQLLMSEKVDKTYVGDYQITVLSTSTIEPYPTSTINLNLHVINGLEYEDPESHYKYTRPSINDTWTLTSAPSETILLDKACETVYEVPVTKVASNFASNSGIARLSRVVFPESYVEIGNYAFSDQAILYSLAIPGVKCVGEGAFEDCPNVIFLTGYDRPRLQVVKYRGFYGCKKLTLNSVNQFDQIEDEAFANSGITELNLGGCIWYIGNNVFENCSALKTIHIDATNPPKIEGVLSTTTIPLNKIEVPLNAVEAYKNHKSWSIYSDLIVGF